MNAVVQIQTWPAHVAARYRAAGYWRGETFGAFLRERATRHPERLAVIGGATRWTYADLNARADRLASGFLAAGLRPGDRAIVQLPNVPEFFAVIFGMFRAGILPVFALPAHRQTEIAHFAAVADAAGYVIPDIHGGFDYRELAQQVQHDAPRLRHVFVAGAPGPYASLADVEARSGPDAVAPQPSDVAFVQLSGGSTGLSKLIPRTHDDYIYSLRRSAEICRLGAHSVYLAVLPVAHNFPMSSPGTLGTFYAGGTVVLSPSPSPEDAFALIARERVTITAVVPPLALIWLEAAATTSHDLASLQVLQVGGAKLTPEVARRIEPRLGVTLQQVFGMAEGLVNYTDLDAPDDVKLFTQGRPMCADDEILIVDDRGQPVAEGEAGHLLTRGPYTIRGYYNDPEANARAFTADGFYRTGDIVSRHASGNLIVRGRATDHINRGGEKVSAEEIEDLLMAHPHVHDVAVVAVPDTMLGERACAFVIPRGEPVSAVRLKAWMRARGIAAYKVPDQVVFIEAFPATGVGKTSRKDLRAALRLRASEAPASPEGA
jgi:2,3-dihydroxybenzoate-AMP ligase